AGGLRSHEPDQAIAATVERGDEALEIRTGRGDRLPRGLDGRNGDAALPETEDGAAERLAQRTVGAARGLLSDQARRGLAAELAERIRQGDAVGAFEQQAETVVRWAVAAHGGDGEIEPPQRGQRGVPPLAHGGGAGCPAGGADCPTGGAVCSAGGAAFGCSASRTITWSPIQCGSHHSVGSTCTPWIIMLKWRWSPAARPVSPVFPIGSPRLTLAPWATPISLRWP